VFALFLLSRISYSFYIAFATFTEKSALSFSFGSVYLELIAVSNNKKKKISGWFKVKIKLSVEGC